jgi:4-hydroxy-3-methylbut-2-en-1-yl diphosphate synthase IspG/GcpE
VLAGARKLADDNAGPEMKHVFIKPDMTIAERRRDQLKRLQAKMSREGKQVRVDVNNGELYVGNSLIFSVKDGFVKEQSANNGDNQ